MTPIPGPSPQRVTAETTAIWRRGQRDLATDLGFPTVAALVDYVRDTRHREEHAMLARPCLSCGRPTDAGSRCPECAVPVTVAREERRGTAEDRGYDAAWQRLSRRARRLQPWCSDAHLGPCRGGLTTDHLPRAWERHAAGQRIRLTDVEVVCQGHNDARGSSRPDTDRATTGDTPRPDPRHPSLSLGRDYSPPVGGR